MLEVDSSPTPSVEIDRIIQLRKELEELESIGRAGANSELAKQVAVANAAIERAELIARTFKLEFSVRGNRSTFYGSPVDVEYNNQPQTGWLSSSDFC